MALKRRGQNEAKRKQIANFDVYNILCIYLVYTSIPPFSKSVRGCKTPGRSGALVLIRVESVGLGGTSPFIVYVMGVSVRVL